MKQSPYNSQAGFTMLMASLISSLLLAIGLAIFNIALKEIALSSSSRESQFAFYVADTGAECALYWDFKNSNQSAFATSTASTINCNGDNDNVANQNISVGGGGINNPTSTFTLTFLPNDYCAIIAVTKYDTSTLIESRGYNSCDVNNSRRVERAIRVQY